jgi:molecular chaperone GrpE (heat shock protein)
MKNNIIKAINLIQEARALALVGQYGRQDLEYQDVKESFDEAIDLLYKISQDFEKEIVELETTASRLKDAWLRTAADFDNFRKRIKS